ncbi:MAG TPA: hypothetical protein VIK18_08765 [Pirellulales bacterium]
MRWRFLIGLGCWLLIAPDAYSADDTAQDTPASDAKPVAEVVKEQTIYIPYAKLRETFERQGRGVFLPYDKFQELWRAARDHEARTQAGKPPVSALISEATHEATVERDVVRVHAVLKLEVIGVGWQKIPLRLSDAAITSATLGDRPARIVRDGADYQLLIEHQQPDAEQLELKLDYARSFSKSPGRNSVEFHPPQAPVSRWQVRVDEAGVKIDLQPLIAASDVPAAKGDKRPHSELQAFVGAADVVRIEWTPRAEGATGLEALASVQAEQQVVIDANAVRTRALLNYLISRADLKDLSIEVPQDHRVVNVFDANVRRWTVAELPAADNAPARQRISVELFEPAKSTQQVVVELERFAGEAGQSQVVVPVVKALAVIRQQGVIVARLAEGLQAEASKRVGLSQIDKSELPASLKTGDWTFSWRYAALPFELTLDVEQVQPRVTVDSLVEARLDPQRLTLDVQAAFDIQRAGVFRLELAVPPGFEVRQVRGHAIAGSSAAQVDAYRIEGQPAGRLVVNLRRKAQGRVGLALQLVKTLNEADLLSPTGQSATLPLVVPRVIPETVEQAGGRLVIYAPESLRVNIGESKGLRSISFQEALAGMQALDATRARDARPVQAFAFSTEPAEVTLLAERRKPQVTVRQLLVARVEPGVVKYEATFFYDILYSGLKSLRLLVPADLASSLRNDTPGVRERVVAPAPENLPAGYIAWSLTGENEFVGSTRVHLSWEKPLDKFDVGTSVVVPLPHLRPQLVDRAWGQIVLVKSEAIDLRPKGQSRGVRPIDPQYDLMPGANVPGAAGAYEFHDDWTLGIEATRYDLEEVKRTSIERAVVRMVLTRADQVAVQAIYRMRSARQRIAVKLPEGAQFDTEPLRINGRSVLLEKGSRGQYSVPLVGQDPDKPLVLELQYTLSGAGRRFDLPEFPDDPAVQKVYVCAYLPPELAVVRTAGPWTDEIKWQLADGDWRYNGGIGLVPLPLRTDSALVSWVAAGVNLARSPLEAFQTDGRLYVFSTLRPAPAPEGSLRLTTVHRATLNWLLLAVLFVVGLLLLKRGPLERALAAGLTIIALVLLGIFLPLLARELVNGALLAGVVIVLVVWSLAAAQPRKPAVASAPAMPPPAEAKPSAPVSEPERTAEPPPAPSDSPPPAPPFPDDRPAEGGT